MKFIRQDIHKKKRLARVWRKPRGCDSKKRLRKQNHLIVSPGYIKPKNVRGKYKGQKEIVTVNSISKIKELTANCVVIVPSSLGFRKKK